MSSKLLCDPLPHTDAFWCLCCRRIWNHLGKGRNCSWWAITPFATLISTLRNNHTFIHRDDFLYFGPWSFQSHLLHICCFGGKCLKAPVPGREWMVTSLISFENQTLCVKDRDMTSIVPNSGYCRLDIMQLSISYLTKQSPNRCI